MFTSRSRSRSGKSEPPRKGAGADAWLDPPQSAAASDAGSADRALAAGPSGSFPTRRSGGRADDRPDGARAEREKTARELAEALARDFDKSGRDLLDESEANAAPARQEREPERASPAPSRRPNSPPPSPPTRRAEARAPSPASAEPTVPDLPARGDDHRKDPSMSEPRRRISETNRGLRMILIASVLIVLISWSATLGLQYIRYMQVQTLVATDQDALRVMCAVEPPTETQFGWMHICETVAGVDGERRSALRGNRVASGGE